MVTGTERSGKEKEQEKDKLIRDMTETFRGCGGNVVGEDVALEGCEGLVMFEEPVFGFSSPDDGIYQKFTEKEVIGPCFMQPGEWLPGKSDLAEARKEPAEVQAVDEEVGEEV